MIYLFQKRGARVMDDRIINLLIFFSGYFTGIIAKVVFDNLFKNFK